MGTRRRMRMVAWLGLAWLWSGPAQAAPGAAVVAWLDSAGPSSAGVGALAGAGAGATFGALEVEVPRLRPRGLGPLPGYPARAGEVDSPVGSAGPGGGAGTLEAGRRLTDGISLELGLGVGQRDQAAGQASPRFGAVALGLGLGLYPHPRWFTGVQIDTRFAGLDSEQLVSDVPRLTALTSFGFGLSLVTRFVPLEDGFSPVLGLRLGAMARFLAMKARASDSDLETPTTVEAAQLGVSLAPSLGLQWAGAFGDTPLAVFFEVAYEVTAWSGLEEDALEDDTVGTSAAVEARMDARPQAVIGTLGVRLRL